MMSADDPNRKPVTYRDAGVDIDAGNALVDKIKPFVRATRRPGADTEIGGFGGLFDLRAAGFSDPILVSATDGVGTKLKVAIDSGEHSTVGIDLVAMCVNDLVVQGAEPLFFLDYFATGKLETATAADVVAGIAEGCKQAGAALVGGETAEMPGMYAADDYDLAGFAVGAVERDALLPRKDAMRAGDVILGLTSSGVHANGFSLVRKLLDRAGLDLAAPAPWSQNQTVGAALLTPTRIYVKALLTALKADTGRSIRALAHITGGGLTENIPRVLPEALAAEIDLSTLSDPGVFAWLSEVGQLDTAEMLRTFNCGVGMVVVVDQDAADAVAAVLTECGETPTKLGRLIASTTEAVVTIGAADHLGTGA